MLYKITTHSLFYKNKYYPVGATLDLPENVAASLTNLIPAEKVDEVVVPEKKLRKPRKGKNKVE
jgi:hypothetical protein